MRLGYRSGIGALFQCALLLYAFSVIAPAARAIGQPSYIDGARKPGDFPLVERGHAAQIYVDGGDFPGVIRAAGDLQADIARVTACKAVVTNDAGSLGPQVVLIGTIGKSALLDQLIRERKIDVSAIAGKWESFLLRVVDKPLPGVASALVIAGSDKRGAIYGIYDLSEQIGVSPWYWWADVRVPHLDALFVKPGAFVQGPPKIKYRGIFLNDEAPALTGWTKEKFGGYNHEFYTKVLELILRLKGNYLWPAMWGSAFNEDDPLNPKLADEYGVVMGTSHHEPMLRAQQEWKRHGSGPWDYSRNATALGEFWTQGIERNKNYESIVTIGMRGDGDLPMSESANVALLEKIVDEQRQILAGHMNPDVTKIPQLWALYKEVQAYYEKGMRVPDDVTLLWCDDNWGNIRRLPTPEERKRPGGAGVYYHFDYVGDPRNYKWINTNSVPRVWEQMNLAYRYGADRIWIVNVGDLKPMEFPIEFFLTFAWDPDRWPKERIAEFTNLWATREFGAKYGPPAAGIVAKYTKYNSRRKPELLEPGTYRLVNFREADRIEAEWDELSRKAEAIYNELPTESKDAFFELVLHPVQASAIVNKLYIAVAKNRLYASQGRASANDFAAQARALFQADAALTARYNHELAGGKWDHMMDQTHIGYTYWQQPETNAMPEVKELKLARSPQMGVAIEGSETAWPGSSAEAVLPGLDSLQNHTAYIDVFNRGTAPFSFTATPDVPWITLSDASGTVEKERRVWITFDATKAPQGRSEGTIQISAKGSPDVTVHVKALRPAEPALTSFSGFVETRGFVSIDATHYTGKTDLPNARWETIEDLGRTGSAMTVFPVTAASAAPPENSPHLEYRVYLFDSGPAQVEVTLSPTLNFVPGRGLRYAISFDDGPAEIVDALAKNTIDDWSTSVKDNARKVITPISVLHPGEHVLKVWFVDPGVVLQRLLVSLGDVPPTYLGPPESFFQAPDGSR